MQRTRAQNRYIYRYRLKNICVEKCARERTFALASTFTRTYINKYVFFLHCINRFILPVWFVRPFSLASSLSLSLSLSLFCALIYSLTRFYETLNTIIPLWVCTKCDFCVFKRFVVVVVWVFCCVYDGLRFFRYLFMVCLIVQLTFVFDIEKFKIFCVIFGNL